MVYKRNIQKGSIKKKYKRRYKPQRKNVIRKVVRRELYKSAETKISNDVFSLEGALTYFYDNSIYVEMPTQLLQIGPDVYCRIGNDIWLKHLRLRFRAKNVSAVPTINFRIMVLWMSSEYSRGGTWTSPITDGDLFYNTGGSWVDAFVDNKKGNKIVYDRKHKISALYSGQVVERVVNVDIPINKKCTYKSGSTLFNGKQLYILFIPDSPTSSVGTQLGQMVCDSLLTFKDI